MRRRCPLRAALAVAALLAGTSGCRVLVELVESDEAPRPDGLAGDASCDAWSFAPAGLDPCTLAVPTAAMSLGDGVWTFDTNSGALTDPAQDATFPTSVLVVPAGGVEVRAVSVDHFVMTAGAVLRVSGKRPLVIVSWSSAEIAGVVDATSRPGEPAGGADPDACADVLASPGEDDAEGGGGGGGGGFGTSGAPGGSGNDGLGSAGGGGAAGVSGGLRGGCSGAAGGNATGGPGGAGGGAVVVAAREQVAVSGAITAGGAGGAGARGGRGGGGGGGAGGYVGLAAASIVLGPDAVLAANGGGGGGGSDNNPALPGQDGAASVTPAAAGAGEGMGGGGGAGGARDAPAVAGKNARRGGGGGGGGVGRIVIDSPDIEIDPSAVLSPAP